MPPVTRLGDSCSGHEDFPPRNSSNGSPNVFVNGLAAHRLGDSWEVHCNSIPVCHAGALASGSSSVFVNGLNLGRIGDPIDCGSSVASGSPNVYAGG